jgi:glycerol uptake facilitator-like aquaporin
MNLLSRRNFVEMLGTFILCLGVNMSVGESIADMTIVYFVVLNLTRNVSGGHANSAVTLGFTVDNILYKDRPVKYELINLAAYFLFQLSGALLACLISFICYDREIISFIDERETAAGIILAESIATFFFVFSYLIQTEERFTRNKFVSSMTIAICLGISSQAVQNISKGCLNSSILLASFIANGVWNYRLVLYFIAQLLGGLVAGLSYRYIFRKLEQQTDNEEKPKRQYGLLNDSGSNTIVEQSNFT